MKRLALVVLAACGGNDSHPVDAMPDSAGTPLTITQADGMNQQTFALVAAQDGDGPWRVLDGSGTWTTGITQDRYGVVVVCARATFVQVNLLYANVSELPTVHEYCTLPATSTATVNVTLANIGSETANVVVNHLGGTANSGNPTATVMNVPLGTQDILVTQRASISAPVDRIAISRDHAIVDGANAANIDMNALGIAPQDVGMTLGAADVGETTTVALRFHSKNDGSILMFPIGTTTFQAVPGAQLQPSETQTLGYAGQEQGTNRNRNIQITFHDPVAQTISLPPQITGQVDTPMTAPLQWRMMVTPYPGAALYQALAGQTSLSYSAQFTQTWFGTSTEWTAPDLTGLAGWDPAWNLVAGAQLIWGVSASTTTGSVAHLLPHADGTPSATDVGTTTGASISGMFTP